MQALERTMNLPRLSPLRIKQDKYPSCSGICMNAILITDARGILTSLSRGAEELFGCFAADVIGKPFDHFLSGGEAEFQALRHSLQENADGSCSSERQVIGKDQSTIPVQLQASFLSDERGSGCQMITICRDLRPIRVLETEIQHRERFFAGIVKESADAILTLDPRERVTSWNKGAETIFGYTEQEMLGSGLEILLPKPLKAQRELESISRIVREQGYLRSYHTQRLTKSGEIREVIFTRTAIKDIHGTLIGFSSVLKDITETTLLEQRLAYMEKLSAMGELSAGIAHEIKNPLGGIKGAIEIVRDSMNGDDVYRPILSQVITEVNRIDRIVMDLLSYAKPKKLEWTRIDLAELIDSVISVLKNMAESQRVSFHLEHEEHRTSRRSAPCSARG
jgi:PAS domain S-box-containing protein